MKTLLTSLVLGLSLLAGCASTPTVTPVVEKQALERQVVRKLEGSFGGVCSMVMLEDGLGLTAAHCERMLDPSVVIKVDGYDDLMLVKTDEKCPCIHVAARNARQDEKLLLVGYPMGSIQFVTEGRVQGWYVYDGRRYMMTEASAAPGNSGGGAFIYQNGELRLVGILVAGAVTGNVNLVVHYDEMVEFLNAYMINELIKELVKIRDGVKR